MPVLQINNLSKSYKTHCVLDEISLDIRSGESFGLIGLNGAGKTTLLKSILNLHQIDAGIITLFDRTHLQKNARNKLAYLPEKFSPPDYLSGQEYLSYIREAHQLRGDQKIFKENINALCQKLDLESSALNNPVNALSKGMNQKLGIMGVLLSAKEFLIMDEPMSGLDPKARYLFKNIILELRQARTTLLFCTHILNDVEQLCDRIGILHKGSLQFIGTPEECRQQFKAENLEKAFLNCVAY